LIIKAEGGGTNTISLVLKNGTTETVKTYIEYQQQFIKDVINAGGIPVASTMTPKGDNWNSGRTKMVLGDEYKFVEFAKKAVAGFPGQATVIDHYNVRTARLSRRQGTGRRMKYFELTTERCSLSSPHTKGWDIMLSTRNSTPMVKIPSPIIRGQMCSHRRLLMASSAPTTLLSSC
jgi:hypothetical protein